MEFPSYTKTYHSTSYPSISPSRPELSTAGKVVVITGGGSGIGPKIVKAFASSGCTKIAILGRTETSLLTTKSTLESSFPSLQILTLVTDISSAESVSSAFARTRSIFGPVDILISNAASLPALEPVTTATTPEYTQGFQVNVLGTLYLTQAFLAHASPTSPTLIHVSAAGVHLPPFAPGVSAYCATKLAAHKVMEFLTVERPDVRVFSVHPGLLVTDMHRKVLGGKDPESVTKCDNPELPANFMVWVASPEADFLNGKYLWANWDVDELLAKKSEVVGTSQLTIGLIGLQ